MGQAKQRGTFEERKAAAEHKKVQKPLETLVTPIVIGGGQGITAGYRRTANVTASLFGLLSLGMAGLAANPLGHQADLKKNLDNLEQDDATT